MADAVLLTNLQRKLEILLEDVAKRSIKEGVSFMYKQIECMFVRKSDYQIRIEDIRTKKVEIFNFRCMERRKI